MLWAVAATASTALLRPALPLLAPAARVRCRRFAQTGAFAFAASPPAAAADSGFTVPAASVEQLLGPRPEVLNKLGEPTFHSLGIGDGLWPSSVPLKLAELLHVDLGAPWWSCAVLLGCAVRCALLYPALLSRRLQSASDSEQLRQLAEMSHQLREARAVNNVAEMRRLSARLNGEELAEARRQSAVLLRRGAAAVGLNLLGVLVLHLGCVRALALAAELPVPGLLAGGPSWLPDLACADPTALLPLAVTCVLLLNLRHFYRVAPSNQLLLAAKPLAFTMAPMLFFTFLLNCPSVLLFYFLATGGAALATNVALSAASRTPA